MKESFSCMRLEKNRPRLKIKITYAALLDKMFGRPKSPKSCQLSALRKLAASEDDTRIMSIFSLFLFFWLPSSLSSCVHRPSTHTKDQGATQRTVLFEQSCVVLSVNPIFCWCGRDRAKEGRERRPLFSTCYKVVCCRRRLRRRRPYWPPCDSQPTRH
jgi:hypothetical protein